MSSYKLTHDAPPSTSGLCENTSSSIKPEVHNVSQRRQRRTEPRPQATYRLHEKSAKFGRVVSRHASGQDNRLKINKSPTNLIAYQETAAVLDVQTTSDRPLLVQPLAEAKARPTAAHLRRQQIECVHYRPTQAAAHADATSALLRAAT